MCQFKSAIILKNRVVLAPEGNESHSDLLNSLGIKDTRENAMRRFIRAELIPKDGNKATDVSEWTFRVDQDITPDWYDEDPKRYEEEFRDAVREYLKEKFVVFAGHPWVPIKEFGNKTCYVYDGIYMKSEFGKTNNYDISSAREKLIHSKLAYDLKEELGDKIVPITTNLLSFDGLDDYGEVKGDILALPTLDLYRECRKKFTKVDKWFYLSTPYSTPSGYGSGSVLCVCSGGDVGCGWCARVRGLRPILIVES